MSTHHRVRTGRRARAFAASGSALLLLAAMALPAAAAGRGATVVRGTQLAFGTCALVGQPQDGYTMTGDLVGCWRIETFESKSDPTKHNFRATGRERFEGCLGTICGAFESTYTFTAKTDGPWGEGAAEIHGRCHHPIDPTSGEGGFAGVTGQLSFHDVVDVAPPYYPYVGSIRVPGAGETTTVQLGSATTSSATGTTC